MRARAAALLLLITWASNALAQEGTWHAVTSGTTESLTGVSFGSASTGLAVGTNGTILRTTDGGLKWSKVTGISGLNTALCCSQVRFFNSSVAWLAGAGTRLRSGSSGSGWFGFTENDGRVRRSVIGVSAETTWITGNSSSGGRSFWRWSQVGNNSNVSSWGHAASETMYGIDFVDADNGWAVGSPGSIVRITGGTSTPQFANQAAGTTVALRGIDMVDASNGWVVGDQGTILRTTNGGATWTKQNSGTVNGLRGVSFKSLTDGVVVGTAGLILTTTDGGATWKPETSGTSVELAFVHHGERTVAVGAAGTILRRTTSPGGCDYAMNPPNVLWGAGGGNGTFTMNAPSGCAWTAVSEASWLTVTSGSGSGDGTVAFTVAANGGVNAREGKIAAGGQKFTVTQYGSSGRCPFTLTPGTASFARAGGSGTMAITTLTGCFWGVFADVAWITVDSPTTGFGSGSATYRVSANGSGSTRTGKLFIGGSFEPNVTVTQSATGPSRRRAVRH